MRGLLFFILSAAIVPGAFDVAQAQGYRPPRDAAAEFVDRRSIRGEEIVIGAVILTYLNFPMLAYVPSPFQILMGFRYWDSPPPYVGPDLSMPVSPAAPSEAVPDAAAPEPATELMVTEAEAEDNAGPDPSVRPPPRPVAAPNAPVPVIALPDQPVSGAAGLTAAEKAGLTAAVLQCWNVGALSSDALAVTIAVGFTMTPEGRPDTGSVRMLDYSGGPEAAARQAFEAARRAIIRCGVNGYDLPTGKYEKWREIEMTFNPERMRIK